MEGIATPGHLLAGKDDDAHVHAADVGAEDNSAFSGAICPARTRSGSPASAPCALRSSSERAPQRYTRESTGPQGARRCGRSRATFAVSRCRWALGAAAAIAGLSVITGACLASASAARLGFKVRV
jgi:hypothetical protein